MKNVLLACKHYGEKYGAILVDLSSYIILLSSNHLIYRKRDNTLLISLIGNQFSMLLAIFSYRRLNRSIRN